MKGYVKIVVDYHGLIYEAEVNIEDLPALRKTLKRYEKKVIKEKKYMFDNEEKEVKK